MTQTEIDVAFLIADLSGYTALTAVHGDLHAATAVARYTEIARAALQSGARLVERVGDEVLIAAAEATAIVQTAIALREAVEREPLFPMVRCGLHAGTAVEHSGGYVGGALNLTARVAAHARGGQILCSEPITLGAAAMDEVEYQPLGPIRFKNIVDPVHIFEVVAGRRHSERPTIDPVCRMQVREDAAPARLPFAGRTYFFCSFECARAFAERPEHYVESPPAA